MNSLKNMSENRKLFLAFLAGLLVGVLGYWVINGKSVSAPKDMGDSTLSSETEEGALSEETSAGDMLKKEGVAMAGTPGVRAEMVVSTGQDVLAVGNQKAGDMVELNVVTVSANTWVAIHEEKDGKWGNVLGAKMFEPGVHLGQVRLLRAMAPKGVYYATLYRDDGDKDFSLDKDGGVKNATGPIFAKFTAQ